MRNFSEQELVRREKSKKIRDLGLDPYGQRYDRKDFAFEIKEKYKDVAHDDFDNMSDTARVAGRIMFIRKMGKASFFTIKDKTGTIQVYISINDVGEDVYNMFKMADIGDIVGVEGKVMKTKTGEVTIKCLEYTHLVKALKPIFFIEGGRNTYSNDTQPSKHQSGISATPSSTINFLNLLQL